jgi:hypothetical protein
MFAYFSTLRKQYLLQMGCGKYQKSFTKVSDRIHMTILDKMWLLGRTLFCPPTNTFTPERIWQSVRVYSAQNLYMKWKNNFQNMTTKWGISVLRSESRIRSKHLKNVVSNLLCEKRRFVMVRLLWMHWYVDFGNFGEKKNYIRVVPVVHTRICSLIG